MYGRVPVPSGNAARAQEIYETVMELGCSLPMADVCVGYSDSDYSSSHAAQAKNASVPLDQGGVSATLNQ